MTQPMYSAQTMDALRAVANTPDGRIYQTASALAHATNSPTASLNTLKKMCRANLVSGVRGEAYRLTAYGRQEAERLGLIDTPIEDDEAVEPAEFAPAGADEELADWKAFQDKQFADDPLIEAREQLALAQARIAALETQLAAVVCPADGTNTKFVLLSLNECTALDDWRAKGWTIAYEQFVVTTGGETQYAARLERHSTPKPAPQAEATHATAAPTMIIDSVPLPTIMPVSVTVTAGGDRRNHHGGLDALFERTRARVQQVHASAETPLERQVADYDMAALTAAQEAYQDALSLMPALPLRSLEDVLDGRS